MSGLNIANESGVKPSKPEERTEIIGELRSKFSSTSQLPEQQDSEAVSKQTELQIRERALEFYDHPFSNPLPKSSADRAVATPEHLELERGYQRLREIMKSRQENWDQSRNADPSSTPRETFIQRQALWDHAPALKDMLKMIEADQNFRKDFEALVDRYSKTPSVGSLVMPGGTSGQGINTKGSVGGDSE